MNQTAQPSTAKPTTKQTIIPRVLIDQNDMFINIFTAISETPYVGKILVIYLTSLAKYNIAAQHDISKMVIVDLVRRKQFDTLQQLIKFSLINESKPLACFLLSLSSVHSSITQMALDMLHKLKAHSVSDFKQTITIRLNSNNFSNSSYQIIIEVLIGQGKIIEALRLATTLSGSENVSARKYLEAAKKTNDPLVFYSVYTWFQQRNIRGRGSPDFLRSIVQYIQCLNCLL